MKSSLKFIGYTVDDIIFKANQNCTRDELDLDFSFFRKVDASDENQARITLGTVLFKDAEENNFPFEFVVTITGTFDISEVELSNRNAFLYNNCIAILFPYVRSIISTYTAVANISPVILPVINVAKLFENADDSEE